MAFLIMKLVGRIEDGLAAVVMLAMIPSWSDVNAIGMSLARANPKFNLRDYFHYLSTFTN